MSQDGVLNAWVLKKRLASKGHDVLAVINGQQTVNLVENDGDFDRMLHGYPVSSPPLNPSF